MAAPSHRSPTLAPDTSTPSSRAALVSSYRAALSSSSTADVDPLALLLAPPANETLEQRSQRLREENEAVRRSRAIDERLQSEGKRNLEKRNKAVKVLLLGQAESGKSTTLKNFQLTFAPKQFDAERPAWRSVIQLNLIASVRVVLDALQAEFESSSTTGSAASSSANAAERARSPSPAGRARPGKESKAAPKLTNEHRKLALRLRALLHVERALACRLSPDGRACAIDSSSSYTSSNGWNGNAGVNSALPSALRAQQSREVVVRPGSGWKRASVSLAGAGGSVFSRALGKLRSSGEEERERRRSGDARSGGDGAEKRNGGDEEAEPDDPTAVLAACREDVCSLWMDPTVRAVLERRGVDVEGMPGFFLNDALRIARTTYIPSDDDILRARLQTLGVEEHRLAMEQATTPLDPKRDWIIYDVGGCRGNRHKWIPYFDDVQAIIFLAPLTFTLTLAEDPGTNRLEDSILLFRAVVAHPLLARATLILFLNKMDLLVRTLKSGVHLRDYVPSYGDQPNEVGAVVKYFRSKFKAYQKTLSPHPRYYYCHETSVVDARATSAILIVVSEGILRANLQDANLI